MIANILRRLRSMEWERGDSGLEGAVAVPAGFMLFFLILALTVIGYTRLVAATVVPENARAAGLGQPGASARLLSETALGQQVAGSLTTGTAPGCQRAVTARLNASGSMSVPMLETVAARVRAGSTARYWRFWAGPPADGCE